MFENRKYLSSSERADMAKLLNVTEQQVRLRLIPLPNFYYTSSQAFEYILVIHVLETRALPFRCLQVKIWFQNRRTKWKKQENISNAEAAELMKAKKENQLSSNLKVGKPSPAAVADNNNISGNGGGASPNVTENGLNALLGKLSPATRDEVSRCRFSLTLSLHYTVTKYQSCHGEPHR